MAPGRELWMEDLLPRARHFCASEPVDSEDTLFIL
jgi:acyl-coenzyme A synthetase/AMP-(fatty) acid ligase